jgi:hypothetical protein
MLPRVISCTASRLFRGSSPYVFVSFNEVYEVVPLKTYGMSPWVAYHDVAKIFFIPIEEILNCSQSDQWWDRHASDSCRYYYYYFTEQHCGRGLQNVPKSFCSQLGIINLIASCDQLTLVRQFV